MKKKEYDAEVIDKEIKLDWQVDNKIFKRDGLCVDRCKWRYCSYYMAKKSLDSGATLTFACALFNEDKSGHESVAACNERYGRTYEGLP